MRQRVFFRFTDEDEARVREIMHEILMEAAYVVCGSLGGAAAITMLLWYFDLI